MGEHAEIAGQLFQEQGFEPLYVERRSDGNVSFWFGKLSSDELSRLTQALPKAYYVLGAHIMRLNIRTH